MPSSHPWGWGYVCRSIHNVNSSFFCCIAPTSSSWYPYRLDRSPGIHDLLHSYRNWRLHDCRLFPSVEHPASGCIHQQPKRLALAIISTFDWLVVFGRKPDRSRTWCKWLPVVWHPFSFVEARKGVFMLGSSAPKPLRCVNSSKQSSIPAIMIHFCTMIKIAFHSAAAVDLI